MRREIKVLDAIRIHMKPADSNLPEAQGRDVNGQHWVRRENTPDRESSANCGAIIGRGTGSRHSESYLQNNHTISFSGFDRMDNLLKLPI
jgi:hypothetical protein